MIRADPFPPSLPAALRDSFTTRLIRDEDVDNVVALMTADRRRVVPDAQVGTEGARTRLVGPQSWSRRQVLVVPRAEDGSPSIDQPPLAWVSAEDRAAGRTNVQWFAAADAPHRDELVGSLLHWAADVGGAFARHRGVEETVLNDGADERDADRKRLLTAAGFTRARTWEHMERPVTAEEATTTPEPRAGVRARRVHLHTSGLPYAQDVRWVHRTLEESFADHFNSYRESFPEFVGRLTSGDSARWDHWWIAEVQKDDGSWWPGGGLVADVMPATATAGEGTYLEYLGVHRSARGRGVAKALLNAAIRDAAERGLTRVGLEVDADSPTGADGLYRSMGWVTTEVSETWHRAVPALPSNLLRDGQ